MIKEYSSLHGHSHFSTMDGISLPEEMVLAAKEKGLRSISITDHGHAHGHADFYLAGKKHGVRTVLGVEAYVIGDLDEWNVLKETIDLEKKTKERDSNEEGEEFTEEDVGKANARLLRRKGHLVILARNRTGLSNIYQLVYKSHKYGFYGKPRMDKKMLMAHAEGLVVSTACMGGVVSNKCWEFQRGECEWSEVVREAQEFDAIFGRGMFFLELQFNEHDGQRFINDCMVRISQETGIPLTVTTDTHYTRSEDWEAQEILYMLRGNKTIATRGDAWDFKVKQLYIKSPEEMWHSFERFGGKLEPAVAMEAFRNTLLIDSLIEDFEPDTHQRLPTLPFKNPFAEMGQRAIAGLRALGLAERDEYKARLLHELKVIKEKGIANYFIIVGQIIAEAKKQMLVGAGRGSSAGSLVCYALGITDLDPIKHGLLFERFLDPDRVELPDIDIDFQDGDAAKEMLQRMFGEDNVASLSTYGTFQIKGLLKDLGRVYDLDHNEVNRVNKRIESELRVLYHGQDKSTIVIRLDDIERVSPTYNGFIEKYPKVGEHLRKLYGRNRNVSRHACGVIIGDNLSAETAVFTSKGIMQASFTEGIVNKNISAMGFVKFDLLNLATLRVIDYALHLIAERTGKRYEDLKESIRPHNMDLNDQRVLKHVFWDGNFAGVFQFTEKGIRRLAQLVKPDCFDDVSAITSLYRPGPLGSGMNKLYVQNKHNPEGVTYDHPVLEDILKRTHGCLVYQEQLMQVAQHLGKMKFKDVQRIRKVLLKKDKSKTPEFLKKENDELKAKFVTGAQENGLTEAKAEEWWKNLLYFGGYGFNASHSYCYSIATMQCAYLATYHPLEFYSALLTRGQSGEMQEHVSDIKRTGIRVLPVDINRSKASHTIECLEDGAEGIRLALGAVNGVGPSAIEKITANQPYSGFLDFLDRSKASKTSVHPLILIGAFDGLPDCKDTRALEGFYEAYLADPKLKNKGNRERVERMREDWPKTWVDEKGQPKEDYKLHERVFFENTLVGFSIHGSPFEILDRKRKIEEIFGDTVMTYQEFIDSELEVAMLPVVVREFKERADRRGNMMAFVKFGVQTGEEFDAPCFSGLWRWIGPKVRKGSVYIATFNRKEDDPQGLIIGKKGFAHSQASSLDQFINVDDLTF